jgi:hypothetical protein
MQLAESQNDLEVDMLCTRHDEKDKDGYTIFPCCFMQLAESQNDLEVDMLCTRHDEKDKETAILQGKQSS